MPRSKIVFWLSMMGLIWVEILPAQTCPEGDTCFSDSFETPFNFPANDAESARFLNQITFGASTSHIAEVRSQGTEAWLTQQLNSSTTTLSRPWLEAYAAALPIGQSVGQDQRLHRWFDVAVNASDQVRQRVAYALSQIVVASDRDGFLINEPIQMAEWNDILVRNALGNYRQLLQEVTYSPMMGRYLTTLRNRKFELIQNTPGSTRCANDASGGFVHFCAGNNGVQPDENYAREVMQLFSIGLLVRGSDFFTTYADSGNPGNFLNTYAEDDISTLARVFTGLSYGCTQGTSIVGGVAITRNCGSGGTSCTGIGCRFTNAGGLFSGDPPRDPATLTSRGLVHPDWYHPMVCYPRYNDNGRDQLGSVLPDPLSTTETLPAGSPSPDKILVLGSSDGFRSLTIGPSYAAASAPLNCNATGSTLNASEQQACIDYCEGNINASIDFLFNHPNLPVMIARQMIQRLVTSNPSPAYVQRVANVFMGDMTTPRGDMKALIKAIIMDVEARRPVDHPDQSIQFGKVREPMLKLIALWRHFGAVSGDTSVIPATNPQGGNANPLAGQAGLRRWGSVTPQDIYQQRPLGAPSVFNFYEPDYKQPGTVSDSALYSPEFQIIHEVSSITAANDLYTRICSGYSGSNNCSSGIALGAPGSVGAPADRAYFPSAQIDLIPARMTAAGGAPLAGASPTLAEDTALIEFFNTRMMGGAMSGSIPTSISCPSSTGTGMKGLLINLLRCSGGINETITNGTQPERQRRKALYLMHMIAISPEYSTQR